MILLEAVQNRAELFPSYTITDPTTNKTTKTSVAEQINQLRGDEKNVAIYKFLEQYQSQEPGSPYEGQPGNPIDISNFINDLVVAVLLWGPDGSNVHQNPIVYFLENSKIPTAKIEAAGSYAIPELCDALEEGDLSNEDLQTYFIAKDTGIFDEDSNAFKYKFDILKIFLDNNQLRKYKTISGDIPSIDWIFNNKDCIPERDNGVLKSGIAGYPEDVSVVTNKFLPYADMKKVAKALVQEDSPRETLSLKKVMQDQFKLTKLEDINTKIKEFFNDADAKKELRVVADADKYQKYAESYLIGDKKDKAQTFLKLVEIQYPYDIIRIIQGIEDKAIGITDREEVSESITFKDIIKNRGWTNDTALNELFKIIKNTDASILGPKAKSTLRSFIKNRMQDDSSRKDLLSLKIASDTDSDIIKSLIAYRKAYMKNKISGIEILANALGIPKKAVNKKHLQDQAIRVCKILKKDNEAAIIKELTAGKYDDQLLKIFKKGYPVTASTEKPLALITPEISKILLPL